MTALTKSPQNITQDEAQNITALIASHAHRTPDQVKASLAVAFTRKEEEAIWEVFHENKSYRGYDDEFILTVQIRIPKYDKEGMTDIQPFIDEAIQGDLDRKAAALDAEEAELAEAEAELNAQRDTIQARRDKLAEERSARAR
jgi:hypothetical protein